jgi:aminomethyltransferase
MKKTVLFEKHTALNAKMAPFGGYEMPIQYDGIIKEHLAVRNDVGMFDTCHMGEFIICGDQVVRDLEKVVSCAVAPIKIGQCKYGFLCNDNGGVVDDQILYRLGENEFMMVVNASTEESDYLWIKKHLSDETELINVSSTTAKIDIQGPRSVKVLQKLLSDPIADLKFYTFKHNLYMNERILISRTGYTGEIGFEIYCSTDIIQMLWDELLQEQVVPAGLGARDTLRLEMGFPLYGHELDETTNAAESGFTRAIAEKTFVGSTKVLANGNIKNILSGFILEGRRSARHGDVVLDTKGNMIGRITSGSYCPSLSAACALGYIPVQVNVPGTRVIIKTERSEINAQVYSVPFYRNATGRNQLDSYI